MAAAPAMESELRITVRLRNYANVPNAILMEAERTATWIFQEAGIVTDWLDCSVRSGQPGLASFCEAAVGPAELSIKVLPSEMIRHVGLHHATLGVALLPVESSEEKFATDAFVCSSCVKDMAMARGKDLERESLKSAILGSVIAHELGHLLGVRDHSTFGLMHTPWNEQELVMAQQGRLLFTSTEKRTIQVQVRMRQMAASAGRPPHRFLTSDPEE